MKLLRNMLRMVIVMLITGIGLLGLVSPLFGNWWIIGISWLLCLFWVGIVKTYGDKVINKLTEFEEI